MNLSDVVNKVISVVSEEMALPIADLTLNQTFEELGINSHSGLGILIQLEKAFNIRIENEAMQKISTLADVVNVIENGLAERHR